MPEPEKLATRENVWNATLLCALFLFVVIILLDITNWRKIKPISEAIHRIDQQRPCEVQK